MHESKRGTTGTVPEVSGTAPEGRQGGLPGRDSEPDNRNVGGNGRTVSQDGKGTGQQGEWTPNKRGETGQGTEPAPGNGQTGPVGRDTREPGGTTGRVEGRVNFGGRVGAGLAYRGEDFTDDPFLKPLRMGEPGAHDEPVNVTFRNDNHFLCAAIGREHRFHAPFAEVTNSVTRRRIPQYLRNILRHKPDLAILYSGIPIYGNWYTCVR